MRKLLITLFLVLILSFGVFGYAQSLDQTNEVVEQDKKDTLIVK